MFPDIGRPKNSKPENGIKTMNWEIDKVGCSVHGTIYHSLGSVSTFTKRINFFFEK